MLAWCLQQYIGPGKVFFLGLPVPKRATRVFQVAMLESNPCPFWPIPTSEVIRLHDVTVQASVGGGVSEIDPSCFLEVYSGISWSASKSLRIDRLVFQRTWDFSCQIHKIAQTHCIPKTSQTAFMANGKTEHRSFFQDNLAKKPEASEQQKGLMLEAFLFPPHIFLLKQGNQNGA